MQFTCPLAGDCSSVGGLLYPVRPDGYNDGFVNIQGARSYNDGIAQWTSADPSWGNQSAPMSLQPYVWNSSNPGTHQDPSGLCYIAAGLDNGPLTYWPWPECYLSGYSDYPDPTSAFDKGLPLGGRGPSGLPTCTLSQEIVFWFGSGGAGIGGGLYGGYAGAGLALPLTGPVENILQGIAAIQASTSQAAQAITPLLPELPLALGLEGGGAVEGASAEGSAAAEMPEVPGVAIPSMAAGAVVGGGIGASLAGSAAAEALQNRMSCKAL